MESKGSNIWIGALVVLIVIVFSLLSYRFYKSKTSGVPATSIVTTNATSVPGNTPVPNQITDWNSFVSQVAKFTFKYPQGMVAAKVGNNETAIKPDEEYVVTVIGKNLQYLGLFLYKSDKDPTTWWNTEGKNKFETLGSVIGDLEEPKVKINLTYAETPTTFAGLNALNVIVSSDYDTPNTPKKRYITLVQHNGFIILTSYKDLGTPTPSIDTSKKILSTFVFTNDVPSPTPSMHP